MIDVEDQAGRFQDFLSQLSEEWRSRYQDLVRSNINSCREFTRQWHDALKGEQERQETFSSTYTKLMLQACLRAVELQREQARVFMDIHLSGAEKYLRYLDELENDLAAAAASAPGAGPKSDSASQPGDGVQPDGSSNTDNAPE